MAGDVFEESGLRSRAASLGAGSKSPNRLGGWPGWLPGSLAILSLALATIGAVAGCLPASGFACDDDRQCTRGGLVGHCEVSGVCSFVDEGCQLGRRYARFADEGGRLGGRCVEAVACAGTPVVELAAGGEHACLRRLDGQLACWGRNDAGQLGDGTRRPRSTPVPVVGLAGGARAIALGAAASCAIDQAGSVSCWGRGEKGELGLATPDLLAFGSTRPIAIPGVVGALELALGEAFGCVRTGDAVICWGANDGGQLGRGDLAARGLPAPVRLDAPADEIAAGARHACARLRDGGVACWGQGSFGQLGQGDASPSVRPIRIAGLAEVVEIAAGGRHTCARLRSGALTCWGDNRAGQIGPDPSLQRAFPQELAELGPIARVRLGERHTCVVRPDESIACFGDGGQGRLGTASASAVGGISPVGVRGVSRVLGLAVGGAFTCVLQRDTSVRCFGADGHGQLGAGGAVWRDRPAAIAASEGVSALSAAHNATCLVRAGELACFGAGAGAGAGAGDANRDRAEPIAVGIPAAVLDVAMGGSTTCARTLDRRLWCWGGRAGAIPAVQQGVGAVDAIAIGEAHACARSRGRIVCWGENGDGQVGQPPVPGELDPVAISLPEIPAAITAGAHHSCALLDDGRVACWGRGGEGQLGDGRQTTSGSPVLVPLPETARAVMAGDAHSCALLGSGRIACWGRAREGQLGVAGVFSATPSLVPELAGVTALALGRRFSCAVSAAAVSCFGDIVAEDNQSVVTPERPRRIEFPAPVVAIAAGAAHLCALDVRGRLACFGLDGSGQLGTARRLHSSWPRPVTLPCP